MLMLLLLVILGLCTLKFIGENPGFIATFILIIATLGFVFYIIGSQQ